MKITKTIFRILSHMLFRTRANTNKSIRKYSSKIRNKKVLEIGSGKKTNGKYTYSVAKYFKKNNEVIMSDINPSFGHRIVDLLDMNFKEEFDVIVVMNVLEHIFTPQIAIKNIRKALRKGGSTIVFVPFLYPLHDEPQDFYRYTVHALKKMFTDFRKVHITHFGLKKLPTAYLVIAQK